MRHWHAAIDPAIALRTLAVERAAPGAAPCALATSDRPRGLEPNMTPSSFHRQLAHSQQLHDLRVAPGSVHGDATLKRKRGKRPSGLSA